MIALLYGDHFRVLEKTKFDTWRHTTCGYMNVCHEDRAPEAVRPRKVARIAQERAPEVARERRNRRTLFMTSTWPTRSESRKRASYTPLDGVVRNECNQADPDIAEHLEQLEGASASSSRVLTSTSSALMRSSTVCDQSIFFTRSDDAEELNTSHIALRRHVWAPQTLQNCVMCAIQVCCAQTDLGELRFFNAALNSLARTLSDKCWNLLDHNEGRALESLIQRKARVEVRCGSHTPTHQVERELDGASRHFARRTSKPGSCGESAPCAVGNLRVLFFKRWRMQMIPESCTDMLDRRCNCVRGPTRR